MTINQTTSGFTTLVDGRVVIKFGVLRAEHRVEHVEVDVSEYALALARDILTFAIERQALQEDEPEDNTCKSTWNIAQAPPELSGVEAADEGDWDPKYDHNNPTSVLEALRDTVDDVDNVDTNDRTKAGLAETLAGLFTNLDDLMRKGTAPIDWLSGEFGRASIRAADPFAAWEVVTAPCEDDGRGPWSWIRLPNGDLCLAVFPMGDLYLRMSEKYGV